MDLFDPAPGEAVMKRLFSFPLPVATAFLSLFLMACNGGGATGGGTGGIDLTPFCEADADCAAGSTSECTFATCNLIDGICMSNPLPEGSPCDDNNGVCRDGFCAQTELKAFVKSPNPEPNALFGTAVSIVGDRMVVGAPSSGPPFGRVAVFDRGPNGFWSVSQQIDTPRLPGGGTDGLFAWSVANAEEIFAVGTLGFSLGGLGSARIFRLRNGQWLMDTTAGPLGRVVGADVEELDLFGMSMAITTDGDTLVVGAPGHTTKPEPPDRLAFADRDYSGAAYVFEYTGLWSEAALLKASNTGGSYECTPCEELACPTEGEGDGFGVTVAVSGETIVVGAPGEASAATGINGDEGDDSAPAAGAAYVFERIDDVWQQTAYLKASNTDAEDRFGFAVAIEGDTIVVGAEREDSGDVDNEGDNTGTDAGAAYMFERIGGVWEQTQYLKASNAQAGFFFGATLAMSDTTLIVGSPGESSIGGEDSGAAYVFTLVDGQWEQTNFYKAFNAGARAAFAGPPGSVTYAQANSLIFCETQATIKGASVSLAGDTVVIGTPYEDSAAVGVNGVPTSNTIPNSGAVYIFDTSEE
jgi:hypothetical protein